MKPSSQSVSLQITSQRLTSILLPGLRRCRRAARLTQIELADRVGLRPETLCRIEKQRQAAGLGAVIRIAAALGVAADRLARNAQPRTLARSPVTERVCTDCGLLKTLDAYVRIRATVTGHYGRCRVCRARRARERRAAGPEAVTRAAAARGVAADRLTPNAQPRKSARPQMTERVCTDCGLLKPLDAFVRIRASATGHYGRCRVCRARRARERYQSDPNERATQILRARRNRLKRLERLTEADTGPLRPRLA